MPFDRFADIDSITEARRKAVANSIAIDGMAVRTARTSQSRCAVARRWIAATPFVDGGMTLERSS